MREDVSFGVDDVLLLGADGVRVRVPAHLVPEVQAR